MLTGSARPPARGKERAMFRMLLVILLAGLGSASFARAEAVRHTGVVAAVQPDGRAITLEEMGPWTGPKQGVVTRAIALTSETKVVTVTRSPQTSPDGWRGG